MEIIKCWEDISNAVENDNIYVFHEMVMYLITYLIDDPEFSKYNIKLWNIKPSKCRDHLFKYAPTIYLNL